MTDEESTTWSFHIPGNPAPWTAWPRRSAPPSGYLAMEAWQAQIEAYARAYWHQRGRGKPLEGLVRLSFIFYLPYKGPVREDARRRWCCKHRKMKPDVTNLQKSCEDGIAKSGIILNDSQVVHIESSKRFAETNEGWTAVFIQEITSG